MKRYFWIAIFPLALLVFAPPAIRPASSGPLAANQKECDCSNLKVLQLELRNAKRLQQNFKNKIAELRGMNQPTSISVLEVFAKGQARQGVEHVPGYNGPEVVDYDNNGSTLNDPLHPGNTFSAQQLCERTESANKTLDLAIAASACAGIGEAVRAHENVHRDSCMAKGFVNYYFLHGADRAQEEVEAYGAQIAVLRAEIRKVLEKAELHVIIEVNTRMQMPANPLYSAIIVTNKADISMNPPSVVGELYRFEGSGSQETNASIEGNCHFNSGLPMSLPARATVETDLTDAKLNYNISGTAPSITMECRLNNQTGRGMSFPVPINNNTKYDFSLVFENGATKEFDQGSGEAAQIMARGGARMSGIGTVKLVFCTSAK